MTAPYADNVNQLTEALKNKTSKIEISFNLKNKIAHVKAQGDVAWAVAFGAICVAIVATVALIPSSAGSGGMGLVPVAATGAAGGGTALAILGGAVTTFLIALGKAAGRDSISAIRNDYDLVDEAGRTHLAERG